MSESYVNLGNAREDDQRERMRRIADAGVCPFCAEHQHLAELEPVLREGEHWTLRKNRWPYKNTRVHLMLVAKRHAEKLSDLPREAGAELLEHAQWAEQEFGVESGALGWRFGDIRGNGGTVRHLHVQFLVADQDTSQDGYKVLRFKMGPEPETDGQ